MDLTNVATVSCYFRHVWNSVGTCRVKVIGNHKHPLQQTLACWELHHPVAAYITIQ